jgi:transposase InsO family protein
MRQHGIRAWGPRRYRVCTTDSKHSLPVAENLLNQNFVADRPDQIWLADITYIPTAEGWLYLAVLLDRFTRKVVGWAMRGHMRAELTIAALTMAIQRRRPRVASFIIPTVNRSTPVPGRSDSNADRPLGRLAPQGVSVGSDPHPDRPTVSFLGPVGRPGTPCGEALPRRCL